MEKRLLIAFVLSAVIFALWSVLFPPPRPVTPQGDIEQETPSEVPTAAAVLATEDRPIEESEEQEPPQEVVAEGAREGQEERVVLLANDVVEVQLTNRGAAISSLLLVAHEGDDGERLELVQAVDHAARLLPLQLRVDGSPDTRLYDVEETPSGVHFVWSDGVGGAIHKEIQLAPDGYDIQVSVQASAMVGEAELAVGTGMRNTSDVERKNRFSTWGDVVVLADGEVEEYRREKLKETSALQPTNLGFAGFSDTYFLSVFRPSERSGGVVIEPLEYMEKGPDGEQRGLQVLQVRLMSSGEGWQGHLFAAPKEYDLLQAQGNGLEETLNFGIFHPISVFFLKALRWIFNVVGNYGVAIILLTLGIRIVLFPLMHTSTVSMRRMQKLQPKVKAIQEKYKKNRSDPQVRAKMNQEMMALYKAEGVNPMGGCLPVLVQLPILWALYTLFAHAIELRHAPFIWWILDLSAKDPLYITPVLMTLTMWLQQKLAPQAGDPQQQKIFRMMPFIFGIMFLGFPSGLVLYWLSNNVITILQQELTLRLIGERGGSGSGKKSGKGKK